MLVEVLERAFAEYEEKKQTSSKLKNQVKKPKKLFSHSNKTFDCDDCGGRFQDKTSYSYVTNLTKSTKTYCGRCISGGKN